MHRTACELSIKRLFQLCRAAREREDQRETKTDAYTGGRWLTADVNLKSHNINTLNIPTCLTLDDDLQSDARFTIVHPGSLFLRRADKATYPLGFALLEQKTI